MVFGLGKKKNKEEKTPAGKSAASSTSVPFRVTIPFNVTPGQTFQVAAKGRIIKVQCPPTAKPGQTIQVQLPA